MRRLALFILVFYALGSFVPLVALADETTRPVKILGKKNRRELRHELYNKRLQADKLRIFKKHGLTSYRLRVDRGVAGVIERWRYPDLGLEFVFDAESRLIDRRRIRIGDRSFD
jgi:hypothetical protein